LYTALAYLMRTPFGRLLVAIRTNESRVSFLGFSPLRAKLIAFVVAADVAALAGSLYPMLRGFVSPELFAFQASGNAVIMVILGGSGALAGAPRRRAVSDAALLEVRELSVSFGALAAVSGLSFSAARGRITSVIGPNGAG